MAEERGGQRRRRREEDPSVRLSKALSYVLRHGAAAEGLPMGPDGFVPLEALLRMPRFKGVTEDDVRRVVAADPKGRFRLSPDPPRIRANQGHSLHVPELALEPLRTPGELPPTLAHGTRRRCWTRIRSEGLRPMGRTHIHLAPGLPGDPGVRSGMRPDSELAIIIDGPRALAEGVPFFRSANGVILSPGGPDGNIPPHCFLRLLQLHPHRSPLPLELPLHEGGGARTPRTRPPVPHRPPPPSPAPPAAPQGGGGVLGRSNWGGMGGIWGGIWGGNGGSYGGVMGQLGVLGG